MKTADDLRSRATSRTEVVDAAVAGAKAWIAGERADGTLIGPETLWSEAYRVYAASQQRLAEDDRRSAWACIAAALVFDTGKVPLNQRTAAREACQFLVENPGLPFAEQARQLQQIADRHRVDAWKIRSLLGPGIGCPWMFPRSLWSEGVVVPALEAILAPFEWTPGEEPDAAWLADNVSRRPTGDFLAGLERRAPEGSVLGRAVAAIRALTAATEQEQKDVGVIETHAFRAALTGHGFPADEMAEWSGRLLTIREAVILQHTFNLYLRAEHLARRAEEAGDADPAAAHGLLARAANVYKRMAVAQMYPERLLERHQQIVRSGERLRVEHGLPDDRSDHVLLISTFQSPGDLQRILLSIGHELMGFAYGKDVRLVVCDDSTGDARARNEQIYEEATRAGLKIAVWNAQRRDELIDRLNGEVFPDGSFDVGDLVGRRKPGEKGVPYGRIRNFLRLAGLVELRGNALDNPVFTWLDQDNELGALVLTRDGRLAKRHVFDYFDQKSDIFTDQEIMVGGGGYTNDALEGVEKFWVAWGILQNALGLARDHAPEGPAVLQTATDITRFRPWDQSDTLERLPREGDDIETMSDQFLLLLNTLIGTFRGKYDNQVQIYHPWSYGYVVPEEERLVEELRSFAGMPGGNTSFVADVLGSAIPFITVGGRGEDIFHLWQLEGTHGSGSIRLTHTPALHTRNVQAGRGDLMTEIVDSFNGRIFREPPYLWAAMRAFFDAGPGAAPPGPDVEAATADRIDGLREEAKASLQAVSGFAREIEPYLDEDSGFWWLAQAESDPRCHALLTTLRTLVQDYKDADRHLEKAEQKLFRLDDVKELTAEFLTAYPHWETVVEHVGGIRQAGARERARVAGSGPLESYGSPLRDEASAAPTFAARPSLDLSGLGEPVDDPPWQEVLTASLLAFRRYERGQAIDESWLGWDARVARLRSLYEHHAALAADVPAFVWTMLYRDALFVPHSVAYRALTELLSHDVTALDPAEITRVAEGLGVDERLLRPAVDATALVAP